MDEELEMSFDDTIEEVTVNINRLLDETSEVLDTRTDLLMSVNNKKMKPEEMVGVLARLQSIDAILSVDYRLISEMFAEMKDMSSEVMYDLMEEDDGDAQE